MIILQILDYVGTMAFAVSGALKGVRKGLDIFGVVVLAVVTAIGGGRSVTRCWTCRCSGSPTAPMCCCR